MLTVTIKTLDVTVEFDTDLQHRSVKPTYTGLVPYVRWVKRRTDGKLDPYGFPVFTNDATAFDFLFVAQQVFGMQNVKANFEPVALDF